MDPFAILPHREVEIECEATPHEPGPFACPISVTYYDGEYHAIKLTVTGTCIAPRNPDHDAPKH